MADLADEYFRDTEAVLDELARERELRARTSESEEGAEFDTVHRSDGRISRRGYVITEDDIVGVWAEYDEEGHNHETTFYTAADDGTLRAEDFQDTDWTIPQVKDEARRWLRELRSEQDR
ncbi:MAG: hypothetical protein GWM90_02600 [Gemmatimonadetes bacterium]|nr:hypothetical protein [Gemmatimonadota bacterium]NIQ52517.1 hypothetical protein [Gemmatimonadota bacterium]NIU72654.1 hypothetical protein [Gammaproteobacteria bacterium]NIX43056.1 hypothetical protein [Gemmatimonadota bacterium]NIY07229.1 hypothetical protein [Gemmatimonadota bacterium]